MTLFTKRMKAIQIFLTLHFFFGTVCAAFCSPMCGQKTGVLITESVESDSSLSSERGTTSNSPELIKLLCPTIYQTGTFQLPKIGYSCTISMEGELVSGVLCKGASGEIFQLSAPKKYTTHGEKCHEGPLISEKTYSEASITRNGRTVGFRIENGTDYPCIFKLEAENPPSHLKSDVGGHSK